MKTSKPKTRVLCAVASGLVWLSATGTAQNSTIIKSFGILTNVSGFNPRSKLAQGPDGALYGTTSEEGLCLKCSPWTTTVYAAIDPTILCSFPVAGTIPLYLRTKGSVGDREQFEPTFYGLAGYPDLYILGAHGRGRKQVQILVRRDDCCFGEAQHDAQSSGMAYADAMRDYERRVRASIREIGRGSFRLEIDETAPSHMISHHAIRDVIVRELRGR